jgi:hypothetical protein
MDEMEYFDGTSLKQILEDVWDHMPLQWPCHRCGWTFPSQCEMIIKSERGKKVKIR